MPPDKRPPSAGRVSGWRPGTGPSLEEATELLATSELTVDGRLPWSSNLTFLVSLEGTVTARERGPTVTDRTDGAPGVTGRRSVQAVYKPHRGSSRSGTSPTASTGARSPPTPCPRPSAGGWSRPTVVRDDGPFGPGSLQLFIEADYEQHYFTLLEEGGHDDVLQAFCAFDVVANNADRKSGHVLIGPDGRLWGIDHGLCFHAQHKLRTVIWDFAGDAVPRTASSPTSTGWCPAGLPDGFRGAAVAGRGRGGAGPGRPPGRRRRVPGAGRRPAALPLAPGLTRRSDLRLTCRSDLPVRPQRAPGTAGRVRNAGRYRRCPGPVGYAGSPGWMRPPRRPDVPRRRGEVDPVGRAHVDLGS